MEIKLLYAGIALLILARVMRRFRGRVRPAGLNRLYNEAYEWIETGWSAVLLAAFLMYFFIQAFKIPSGSMRRTLLEGDHLFVNKFVYGLHVPFSGGKRILPLRQVQRGDIVVFECPPPGLSAVERERGVNKDFIKRCVALAGDTVEIRDKQLYVNGGKVEEPYVQHTDPSVYSMGLTVMPEGEEYQEAWETGRFNTVSPVAVRDNFGPVVVPEGHYFVLGDNRDYSYDARFWGPLADRYMKGKALFLYWPPKRIHVIQ